MEQTVETLSVRVDKLERDTAALFEKTNTANITLAAVNEKLCAMLTTLGEVKQAVAGLQARPGRLWEIAAGAVIAAAVSGAVGFLVAALR